MSDGHIFLSYSRRQFYFAESVVLDLQAAEVSVWFDVQELAPGEQWRDEIARGLDGAAGLVVIASAAAMASKYVRQEWETVLDAGKPVYVVVFEACVLPDKLAEGATAIIDMRGRFGHGIRRLLAALRGELAPRDPVPAPNAFDLPTRVPFAVGLILSVLGLMTAFMFFVAVYSLRDWADVPFVVLFSVWAWYMGDTAFDFVRRRFTHRRVWVALGLLAVVFLLVIPPLSVLPLLALVVYFRSAGVYRWLPTGQAPQWVRERHGSDTVPTLAEVRAALQKQKPPQSQRYIIYYAPADDPLARDIEAVLKGDGHVRVMHDEPADQHIVVLTNHTPIKMLAEMVKLHPDTFTPVLASNIDPRGHVEEVGEFQFIDYRRHSRVQLEAISLFYQYPKEGKIVYGMNVLPQSTSVMLYPPSVERFGVVMWVSVMGYLFLATLLMSEAMRLLLIEGLSRDVVLVSMFPLILFVVAILSGWLLFRVNRRDINTRVAVRWLVVHTILSFMGLTFGVPQLIAYLFARAAFNHWLPNTEVAYIGPNFPHARPWAFARSLVRDGLIVVALAVVLFVGSLVDPTTR